MSLLRGYQHWATLGLLNDVQGQQDVRYVLHNIYDDFPEELNLKSAPTYDRLRRAIARRIRDMPAKILCLHRDDAVGALYELFKLCRSDWSSPPSAKSQDVSGGGHDDGDDNSSEILFVESSIRNGVGSSEGLPISQGDKVAIATTNLATQASDPDDEYAGQTNGSRYTHADSDSNQQRPCTDVVLHNRSHVIARGVTRSRRRRQEKHGWDQFDYQHNNVVFNAFVDITWARYPRCCETIRLSDMLGRIPHSPSPQEPQKTQSTRGRYQNRSPDGDWIRLDTISLSRMCKQLQLMRSFERENDAIWWSKSPLNTTSLDSVAGQIRVDNQRDLIWAVYRSFDAPWQEWRGRRCTPMVPSRGKCPHFSIIIRDTGDLIDTFESMDFENDGTAFGPSGCESVEGSGGSEEPESVSTGDELADILSAIINEPVQSNTWA